jgi:NAD(P)-dependent dehydrogenase (short-subunit alcohol dehydrogenase family)
MAQERGVALVTGANRGIGLELVEQLAREGFTAILGSRDLEVVREALETNVIRAWRTAQACLPLLRRSAHGRLVNVSSGAGSLTGMGAGTPAYSVSKAALNAMTLILAAELRNDGVLVKPSASAGWPPTSAAPVGAPSRTAPPAGCGPC